jgi:type I restriction enzyme M protein
MNKQQLAAKIWESANRMRSKIEANEYKDYILGFIFYKYLSDKEEHWLLEREYDKDSIREYVNEEADDQYSSKSSAQQSLGYFIAYKDLFSTWIHMGSDFSVDNVRTGLSSFNRLISESHKKVFEGIFNTLETGLSKLGENTKSQTKAVSDLIRLIDKIPMNGKQDYDVLGFIYEYLISNFAANAGKKAGEFYTPHEVSLLMSEIVANHLKGRSEIKIYDVLMPGLIQKHDKLLKGAPGAPFNVYMGAGLLLTCYLANFQLFLKELRHCIFTLLSAQVVNTHFASEY